MLDAPRALAVLWKGEVYYSGASYGGAAAELLAAAHDFPEGVR